MVSSASRSSSGAQAARARPCSASLAARCSLHRGVCVRQARARGGRASSPRHLEGVRGTQHRQHRALLLVQLGCAAILGQRRQLRAAGSADGDAGMRTHWGRTDAPPQCLRSGSTGSAWRQAARRMARSAWTRCARDGGRTCVNRRRAHAREPTAARLRVCTVGGSAAGSPAAGVVCRHLCPVPACRLQHGPVGVEGGGLARRVGGGLDAEVAASPPA